MAQKFMNNGYEIVDFEEEANICIINTCTVTNMSDKKSRQMLRKVKEKFPKTVVVAIGCYAQVAKNELGKIDEIDLVLGNNEKSDIVEYIERYIIEKNKISEISDVMYQKEFKEIDITTYTEKTRAVIKVQDGCDRFCSYCIIPYARGRVRSRSPENVVKEINEISKNGIKEVVITGIHVASYGKDFKEEYRLIDLLEEINKIEGIKRIRVGSIEPTLITETFLERAKKIEKLCHHFHLSLQSGCDETLKRMNRKYKTEEFEKVVNLLRNTYEDVILTTDIIVGFPGETEEEFEKTYQFLNKIKFYKMHIFKFSPRKGTKAEKLENQIDGNIKEERSNKLIELSNKNQLEYNKNYVGKDVEVLYEDKNKESYQGHTQNYILVKCKNDKNEEIENRLIKTKIISIDEENLIGEIV